MLGTMPTSHTQDQINTLHCTTFIALKGVGGFAFVRIHGVTCSVLITRSSNQCCRHHTQAGILAVSFARAFDITCTLSATAGAEVRVMKRGHCRVQSPWTPAEVCSEVLRCNPRHVSGVQVWEPDVVFWRPVVDRPELCQVPFVNAILPSPSWLPPSREKVRWSKSPEVACLWVHPRSSPPYHQVLM